MKQLISFALVVLLGALAAVPASAGGLIRAKGDFTVALDLSSFALTPVDENCLLTVEGTVHFTGTLEGIATARTRALVLASCADTGSSPPGFFADVFTSAFEFAGKVDGRPVVVDFTYRGDTLAGGEIDAVLVPSNGVIGRLNVDGIVGVGGSYSGFLKVLNR